MKKILMMLMALCLLAIPALAAADGSVLRTQGSATLTVAPDRAVLSVGYAGEETDPGLAQQHAAGAINAVLDAVKALGVEEADISTDYLNTYPVYNYTDAGQTLRGYRVEHMLSITVAELDTVGEVLDAALAAGANQANGITYTSSKEGDVYLQALALAVESAASKADALAIASGVWLAGLSEINEITSGAAPYARYATEAQYDNGTGSLGGSLITGDLKVTASVELVYSIR